MQSPQRDPEYLDPRHSDPSQNTAVPGVNAAAPGAPGHPAAPASDAAAVDRFVTWIARARAYNGSDVDGGQEAYDRGFNTLLARWAHEYRTDLDSTGLDSTGKGGGRS